MDLNFLNKGLLLGFSVAAPVGPIGILCINRTIKKNFAAGFVSGLGAATADLIYGLIAGSGLTLISDFLIYQKLFIQLMGLLFLFYLGIKTLIKRNKDVEINEQTGTGLIMDYLSTLFLTITNPLTILFFIALFSGLGLSNTMTGFDAVIQLITGVFVGSCIWWMFLSGLTVKLKTRLGKSALKRIDLVSGILILSFGLFILIDLLKEII